MTFDEKILTYEQSDKDRILADIAQTIIEAYNGSYKPHIIQNPGNIRTKHTIEGYSLLKTEQEHLSEPKTWVLITEESIADYICHTFLVLGKTRVKWEDVYKSETVNRAVARYLDILNITVSKIELSNFGYNQYFDNNKQLNSPIRPTVWVTVDLKETENSWQTMESKGFVYFDRNIWYLELDSHIL